MLMFRVRVVFGLWLGFWVGFRVMGYWLGLGFMLRG